MCDLQNCVCLMIENLYTTIASFSFLVVMNPHSGYGCNLADTLCSGSLQLDNLATDWCTGYNQVENTVEASKPIVKEVEHLRNMSQYT